MSLSRMFSIARCRCLAFNGYFYTMRTVYGRILLSVFICLAGLAACFIVFCLAVDQQVQFRMNDAELTAFFSKNRINGRINYYTSHGRSLRYVSIGNDTLPTLLLIHGAPASLSYFRRFYNDPVLLKRFKI